MWCSLINFCVIVHSKYWYKKLDFIITSHQIPFFFYVSFSSVSLAHLFSYERTCLKVALRVCFCVYCVQIPHSMAHMEVDREVVPMFRDNNSDKLLKVPVIVVGSHYDKIAVKDQRLKLSTVQAMIDEMKER